jgi:hypothetical protein
MKSWFILYLTFRLLELANMETLNLWEQEQLTVGVVDRVEGEKAVILVEERNEEFIVHTEKMSMLAQENEWYLLSLKEKEAVLLKALPKLTREQRQKSNQLTEKLRNKE